MRFGNVLLYLVIIGFLLYMFFEFMAAHMRTELKLINIANDVNKLLMKDKISSFDLSETRPSVPQLEIEPPLSLDQRARSVEVRKSSPIDYQPTPPKRLSGLTDLYRTIHVPSTVCASSISEETEMPHADDFPSPYRPPKTESESGDDVVQLDMDVAKRISEGLEDPVLVESS